MANTESNIPTSGTDTPDPFLMGLVESDEDKAKYDKALADAFPELAGNDTATGAGTEITDEDGGDEDDDDTGTDDPNAGASAEGEEEGSGDTTQPPGAIGGDAADFATLFRSRYNRDPQPGELEGYIALAEWAAGLTPEQQVAINRALESPDAYLQPTITNTPPPSQEADELEEEFGADHPLVKRIRALEAATTSVSQSTIQQQQERTLADIQSATQEWKGTYTDLSDIELEQLQGAVARSRIFPGFVQANNGDVKQAMKAALDYAYWQNPTYRDREIQKQYAALEEQKKAEATRKRKASSVSGTGGNGASRTQAPPATNDSRWAAVAAGLGEAMSNGERSNQ